jgi:hypothetical protein
MRNNNRRSLARHVRNRRYELAAIATLLGAAACANNNSAAEGEAVSSSSSPLVTSQQGIAAAQLAMSFMVPDAVTFTEQNQCLSCHRQPDTLISTSIAAKLLPGVTLDTSATTGTGFIANLVTGNQQSDGHWTDSGSTLSMSAESLWALAGYASAGGNINVLPNVKQGLLWLVPEASTVTFPNDSGPFAGQQRTYLNNDFTDSPQMWDWYLPTAQIVFATRVSLDLDSTLSASNVTALSAQQTSYTDALEGTTMRALASTTVQHLALTGIAMAESGRTTTSDGQAIANEIIARQTAGSGWGDPALSDPSLQAVNNLTTGQALYALCRLGIRPRSNPAVSAGLDWLAAQQQSDGEWLLPTHNSAVSSSWALLAMACASNPIGTAEFDPLTANGSPEAPVSESFTSLLNVTNTASDARTATITVSGGPPGASITATPSSLSLAGDASAPVNLTIVLPPGLSPSTSYPFTATVSFAAGGSTPASQVTAIFTTAIGSTPDPTLTATTTTLSNPPSRVDIGSTVPLSLSVKDSGGNPVGSGSATFAIDGQVFSTVTGSGGVFSTNWTVPTLSIGQHTLQAAYLGVSGAIVLSPSSAIAQTIDVEPPPPPSPVVSGIVNGSSSATGLYNLSGTGTPGDTIAIFANGVIVRTATVASDGTWGASFSLDPGAYTVGVVETGPGGSSAPTVANVTVQPSAPTIAGPFPGTTYTGFVMTVSGMATPGATIDVLRGGVVIATTTAANDGSYSVGVNLVPGTNDLSVSQTVNGQTSALSNVVYNETPSAPSITSPATPTSAQKTSMLDVSGQAVPGATVLLVDNSALLATAVADANGNYAMRVALSSGKNLITTTASVGGIVSAPSAPASVRVDGDAPLFLSPPANQLAYAPTDSGTTVSWPAIAAYDAQDGQVTAQCDHASGSSFPLGSTKVTCSAADSLGNSASTSFSVQVVLQQLPTLELPPGKEIVVKSAIAAGANVSFDVTAKNAEGKPIAALCSPASGSFFAAGTTRVNCSASDSVAMTAATAAFDVTVIPVPYYGVSASGAAPAATGSSGGCNTSGSSGSGDLGAIAGVVLALAVAGRRRKVRCVD